MMELRPLTKDNINGVVKAYCQYFNTYEDGCWSEEQAFKRLSQLLTMEDALNLLMYQDETLIGLLNGYYLQFDDERALFINEMVIFQPFQNQGYGSIFLTEVKKIARANGAGLIELMTVNDNKHRHFYAKNGYRAANHLVLMGLRLDDDPIKK